MNIRNKTLMWLLLPSILLASIVTIFWYLSARKTIKQNIFSQLEMAADELEEHVQLFLKGKRSQAFYLSSDFFIKEYTEEITEKESRKEYYTNALNNHLIVNKSSLDPNILEVSIVDLNGKVIASGNKYRIDENVSNEEYFTEAKYLSAFVGNPHYENNLNAIVIDFSTVLLSKDGREAIGVIVNRIKFEQENEYNYSKLVIANKARIVDFSSDGFIRDYTEEISRREDRVFYYTSSLNTHLSMNMKPIYHDIISIFIADLTGRIVASSEFGLMGKNVSDEVYFTKTMQRGSCISDLRYIQELKHSTFEVARLLLDKEKQNPIGVIVNRYDGDILSKITRSGLSEELGQKKLLKGLGETGEMYIVNGDRLMITGSRFVKDAAFNTIVDTKAVSNALDNGLGMAGMYPDYRGVPIIGVSRYIEEMDWVVLSEKDVSEAFAPIMRLGYFTIIMGGIGLITIVIVATLLATGITKPIKKLTEGTQRIANGNLEQPIQIDRRRDEVKELGESFNIMMENLKESRKKNDKLFLLVKRGRDEWQKTFDAIKDIITIHDEELRITRANKAFFDNFISDVKQFTGKKYYEIFYNTEGPLDNCPLARSLASLKPEHEEMENLKIDGTFLMSAYPLLNEKGEIYGVVHLAKDITYQKKLQKQFIDKANKLERVNSELEDFVYITSHDLKEPLFVISSYTSKLSRYKDDLNEKAKLYVNRIKSNAEIMSQKINDVMDVLKVGRITYNLKNNDTQVIVEDVLEMLESKIKLKKVNVQIQGNLPTVLCDEKRLKDVFLNLTSNAIKFTHNDNKIKIGCVRDNGCHKFFVEDTGIGIRKEYHEQIFKMFRRLKDVETEGTGVGLSIVKKIVEQHNGNIWVESPISNEKGSRFCFTIPA